MLKSNSSGTASTIHHAAMRTEPSHANQLNARWCYYRSRAQKSYRAVEIRGPELDVEVERRGASRHGPRGRDPALGGVGLGVGPRARRRWGARRRRRWRWHSSRSRSPWSPDSAPTPASSPQHLSPTAQHQQEKRKKKNRARAAGGSSGRAGPWLIIRLLEQDAAAAAYKSGGAAAAAAGVGLGDGGHRRGVWDLGFAWGAGNEWCGAGAAEMESVELVTKQSARVVARMRSISPWLAWCLPCV